MPSSEPRSEHLFVICQHGAEAALKREVGRIAPTLRAGYQRPGLLTFRSDKPVTPTTTLRPVLARALGMSLGPQADLAVAITRIRDLEGPLRLHVFERDHYRPDEAPPLALEASAARERNVEHELRAALDDKFLASPLAELGDSVLSVVLGGDDPILLGLHVHDRFRSPHPGGRYPVDMPSDSPSRAYRKIEEAIAAFALPFTAGDRALELGSAPGGATYALLRRGVSVIGVDPADMDPHVLGFEGPSSARLRHIALPMAGLRREDLPERIDWLLLDVNLAPQVALRTARSIAQAYRHSLLGAVLTLKLNQWSFLDELPEFEAAGRDMGMPHPMLRQLPSHRQEICVAGLTDLGMRRLDHRKPVPRRHP